MPERPLVKHTRSRLLVSFLVGVAAGVPIGVLLHWQYGVLVGWILGCGCFLLMVFRHTRGLTAEQTRAHAVREDPGRGVVDVLTTIGLVAGMTTVVVILVSEHGASGPDQFGIPVLGLAAIAASWSLVQTVYMLRYARLYYGEGGKGVDFNQEEAPTYGDFAYLSFTLGMTYQVSDTDLKTRAIRHQALVQALVSYLFGAFILAATINILAGLGS